MPYFRYVKTNSGRIVGQVAYVDVPPKNKFERDNNPIVKSIEITDEEANLGIYRLIKKYPPPEKTNG